MKTRNIPYSRQDISQEDIEAVVEVLRSPMLTQGPKIAEFEKMLSSLTGNVRHVAAVSSATAGLHLVYQALGMGPGKRVWTSPNTFVATANAARYCGAEVNFVDIDPDTRNMSTEALASRLVDAERVGELPDLVVPVHFSGLPCDMAEIHSLSKKYGFAVVEDAAHALGATYRSDPVGACTYSQAAVMSFHPVKMITTGEGGSIHTRSSEIGALVERRRTHGITREPSLMRREAPGAWYYEQLDLGFHYRITDMQAALGLSQLRRLPEFVSRRTQIANRYHELLVGLPVKLPAVPGDRTSSWHLYVIELSDSAHAKRHRAIFGALRERGIGVNLHYFPVHLQPYYLDLGFSEGLLPVAERYARRALSLPIHTLMSEDDQDYVVQCLREVLHS